VSSATPPLLQVRGLAVAFGEGLTRVDVLRGVDLDVARGEFLAVMGASGSGKSTLLHLIAGLAQPSAGSIVVDGVELVGLDDDRLTAMRRRRIGIVFQSFNLLPVLTALENVALPLAVDGVARGEAERRAMAALERVGVSHRAAHVPSAMSGGEQQRVAIARAIVAEPVLILADEPTGNLDSVSGDAVMRLLRALADDDREPRRSIVMVTHDADDAATADRVLRLSDGCVVGSGAAATRARTTGAGERA
jgi:putative ABC transport system ATP-binding protein